MCDLRSLVAVFTLAVAVGMAGCSACDGASGKRSGSDAEIGGLPDGGASGQDDTGGPRTTSCTGFQDDFSSDELLESKWRTVGFTGWTLEQVDGLLVWAPRVGHNNTRTGLLQSFDFFDLTGCSTWVEVVRALPMGHAGEVSVSITAGQMQGSIRMRGGMLDFGISNELSSQNDMTAYSAVEHRWWRFREASGLLFIETSPDGREWSVQMEGEHNSDVSGAKLSINVIDTSLTDDFDPPQFDNVNVAP